MPRKPEEAYFRTRRGLGAARRGASGLRSVEQFRGPEGAGRAVWVFYSMVVGLLDT